MVDVFGSLIETFMSPGDALVERLCTSPAINNEGRPHRNFRHQHLVQLADDPHG